MSQVEALFPPTNLSYLLENDLDVKLTWEAPQAGTPTSYIISRGGIEVATVDAVNLTYTDTHVYPDSYFYTVFANYGVLGSSDNSATVEVAIQGSIERNYVLYEIFTGTWCQYCPTAARAIDQVAATEEMDVAIIEYHGGDNYETDATNIRTNFYYNALGMTDSDDFGYPASITNGSYSSFGAYSLVATQKDYYTGLYYLIKPKSSIYRLDTYVEHTGNSPYTFDLHVEVEELAAYYSENVKLYVVLTETNISQNWQGLTEVNFVARETYPNANGTILDFSTESVISSTIEITIPSEYNVNKCEVVAFVQLTGSNGAEILQVNKNSLSSAINVESQSLVNTQVYPNPANDILNISAAENIDKIEIANLTGQTIDIVNPNSDNYVLNTSNYTGGIYFVKVYSTEKVTNHKVTIQ